MEKTVAFGAGAIPRLKYILAVLKWVVQCLELFVGKIDDPQNNAQSESPRLPFFDVEIKE